MQIIVKVSLWYSFFISSQSKLKYSVTNPIDTYWQNGSMFRSINILYCPNFLIIIPSNNSILRALKRQAECQYITWLINLTHFPQVLDVKMALQEKEGIQVDQIRLVVDIMTTVDYICFIFSLVLLIILFVSAQSDIRRKTTDRREVIRRIRSCCWRNDSHGFIFTRRGLLKHQSLQGI